MSSLEHQYGRAFKPEELAEFLAIDVPAVLSNVDRWGGFEVAPGEFRFFQKKIDKVFDAQSVTNEDSTPTLCFYPTGDYWKIGKIREEAIFKTKKGLGLTHFLLGRPREQIAPEKFEYLGKASREYLTSTNGPGKFFHTDEAMAAIAKKSETELKTLIQKCEEIIEGGEYESQEQLLEIKQTIKFAKESLYEKKNNYHSPESKSARDRVGKAIWRAQAVIIKELPYLERYLNRSTIHTGYDCYYNPLCDQEPKWILHKNELPKGFQ